MGITSGVDTVTGIAFGPGSAMDVTSGVNTVMGIASGPAMCIVPGADTEASIAFGS